MVGDPSGLQLLRHAEQITQGIRRADKMLRLLEVHQVPANLGRLTQLQAAVLQVLVETGGMYSGKLALHFDLAHSTMSALLTKLEGQGLVARVPDPRNRRSALIVATAIVHRSFRELPRRHIHAPMAELLAHVSAEDRVQIVAGFDALNRFLETCQAERYEAGRAQVRPQRTGV